MTRFPLQPAPAANKDAAGQWIGNVDPNFGDAAKAPL